MKPDRMEEAQRWLRQSQNDLAAGGAMRANGFYAQACFQAQQAAEKALKALAYLKGERFVHGHSVKVLLDDLVVTYPELATVGDGAGQLDLYYITARYPNALPGSAPFEVYRHEQAEEAVSIAEGIIQVAERLISRKESK